MRELVDSNHAFGFEINKASFSYAEAIKRRGGLKISAVKMPLDAVEVKELVVQADPYLTVLGIDATDTLVRTLQVPLKKDAEINDAIPFQAEPMLPFSLEDAVLDWVKVEGDIKGTTLTFAAVKKETAEKALKNAEDIGLDPEIVSSSGFALAAFSKQLLLTDQPHFIVHIGDEKSLFAIVVKGKLLGAQGSSISMNEIRKAFQADLDEKDPEAIDQALKTVDLSDLKAYPKLAAALNEAKQDITRNIFGLAKLMKGEGVEEAFVSGNIVSFPNVKSYLLTEAEKKEVFPEGAVETSLTKEKLAYFALPIGLALQGVEPSSQINFRQGPLAYPKPLKRIIKPLGLCLASCLALSVALFILGSTYFSYRENNLREEYVALLESMSKTYQEGEAGFAGIKENQESYEPIDIKKLDAKAIEDRLDRLEKEIKTAPDFIALNPNTPRVSDVLAWLTSHPNVGLLAPHLKEGEPAIGIENFNYTLVKRPEEKKRDLKYQAKVELEFTSPSPKLAREFHDSLIAPNEMVDPKGEIKWSSTRGKYKTSFFLKDKTFYPSTRSF